MLSVEDAQALILAEIQTTDVESVPLVELAGRVAAEPLVSQWPLPGWDNSAMDGYAVRADDVQVNPSRLRVSDHIAAGDGRTRSLIPNTAARIFTGALLPEGADTVIVQEDTVRDGEYVSIQCIPRRGQHIRRAGTDIAADAAIVSSGRVLSPGDVSLLASQGYVTAPVFSKPVVTVLTTGDELRMPGSGRPGRGEIIDGNTVALLNAIRQAGGVSRAGPVLPDHAQDTETGLRACAPGFVVSTGGASVGEHDHVANAVRTLCGDGFKFWKVAVKPGKPVIFGRNDTHIYFGLPGNPVSALVSFELFVRPALRAAQGHPDPLPTLVRAHLENSIPKGGRRREYRRGLLRNTSKGFLVRVFESQSSGALSSIAGANALVLVPKNAPAGTVGDAVSVLPIGGHGTLG